MYSASLPYSSSLELHQAAGVYPALKSLMNSAPGVVLTPSTSEGYLPFEGGRVKIIDHPFVGVGGPTKHLMSDVGYMSSQVGPALRDISDTSSESEHHLRDIGDTSSQPERPLRDIGDMSSEHGRLSTTTTVENL
ncbi:unnamed protein product [Heligmosomoides polygyrus]|uniref:BCAS3 domain-containing protein n=1 Tax=Heligmosomoides polygyrus TaxID=6339 RepID=A0A183GMN1_HELPZ|nr:unnamed protein product [Heligmosomoides polygyrus]